MNEGNGGGCILLGLAFCNCSGGWVWRIKALGGLIGVVKISWVVLLDD